MKHLKKILILTFSLFTLFICWKITKHFLAIHCPVQGTLVDIGGYKLHLTKSGTGSPTVILEAGLGGFSLVWSRVQPAISECTTVCSYDRAGMGWSDTSPLPRTIPTMVKELHTLLQNAHVPPPYILVGHSFGGLLVQAYAATYPDEVVGLVLVDALHELLPEQSKVFNLSFSHLLPFSYYIWQWLLNSYNSELLTSLSTNLGIRLLYLQSLIKSALAVIPEEIKPLFGMCTLSPSYVKTMIQETYCITCLKDSLGFTTTIPLIVISRGKDIEELTDIPSLKPYLATFHHTLWNPSQQDFLTRSTHSQQIIATQSGHNIIWTEPELIIKAIQELVEITKTSKDKPL